MELDLWVVGLGSYTRGDWFKLLSGENPQPGEKSLQLEKKGFCRKLSEQLKIEGLGVSEKGVIDHSTLEMQSVCRMLFEYWIISLNQMGVLDHDLRGDRVIVRQLGLVLPDKPTHCHLCKRMITVRSNFRVHPTLALLL